MSRRRCPDEVPLHGVQVLGILVPAMLAYAVGDTLFGDRVEPAFTIAKVCLTMLAIAAADLASISERRQERMVNPSTSDLPAFLTRDGGLESGFMMAHVTSDALVSEMKGLANPAVLGSHGVYGCTGNAGGWAGCFGWQGT